MEWLCEKYKYLNTNKGYNTAKFSVDDVLRSTNETDPEDCGFDIKDRDRQYVESTLLPYVESEDLISKLPEGKYELTEKGKKYCSQKE
ncbi:MAG: hypothetical protein WB988_19010 [Candidatus Nitrosopolaris sp.]